MSNRPYLSPVVKGWKQRQAIAEAKQINGQSREERERIAEIRRQHRQWEEEQTRKAAQGIVDEPEPEPSAEELSAEASVEVEAGDASPEPENAADGEPLEQSGDSLPDPADMDRDALIAELQDAGEKVHPASKDATLRRKVEALR